MKTRSKLLAALVASVFALGACSSDGGGGDSVSPEAYAQGLCGGLQTYLTSVQTLTTDFTTGLDPAASLDDQKASVVDYLGQVIGATDTLIADVDAAGVPDVDAADALVAAVNGSFQDAKTVLEDARTQVEALTTDDPQAFATELNEIGVAIQSSLGGIGDSLSELETPELSEAVQGEPACQDVAATTGI